MAKRISPTPSYLKLSETSEPLASMIRRHSKPSTPPPSPRPPPGGSDEDEKRLIYISASVGGFLFLVILFLLVFYCYKKRRKRRDRNRHFRDESVYQPHDIQRSEFVYQNPALQINERGKDKLKSLFWS